MQEKLTSLEQNIKNARADGREAAGKFSKLEPARQLRLLGFALCGAYVDIINGEARQFEKLKFESAKKRGNESIYAKGTPLGIEYKEAFIAELLDLLPDYKKNFFEMPPNPDYESRKTGFLRAITDSLAQPESSAANNDLAEKYDSGMPPCSDAGATTTATVTTTTVTSIISTPIPTATATTTTVEESDWDRVLDALVKNAAHYLENGKTPNCYTLKLAPEIHKNEDVLEKMAQYTKHFDPYRSEIQKTLYDLFRDKADLFMQDVQIFCAMPWEISQRVAFSRELCTRDGLNPFSCAVTEFILGNEAAEMRSSSEGCEPGNQLAFAMRVPMWSGMGDLECLSAEEAVWILILSVCAPALDAKSQPEWKQYVDENGNLKEEAFALALSTISEQIIGCAKEHPDHKVVLSGFGMSNFINGLNEDSWLKAFAIGVANMQKLIRKLQEASIEMGYTDGEPGSKFWTAVQKGISVQIQYVGRVPGKWISGKVILVNAWDPCSVIGNGCVKDYSIDGFIGRSSLVHEAHVMLIRAFRAGMLNVETIAATA